MDTGKQPSARFEKVEHRIIISLVAGLISLLPPFFMFLMFVALLFGFAAFFELLWLLFRTRPLPSARKITRDVAMSLAAIAVCLFSLYIPLSGWLEALVRAKAHKTSVALESVKAQLSQVSSPQRAEKVRSLKLPEDPFARPSPIHYRANSDGSVTLWGIGPDKIDQFARQSIYDPSNGTVSLGDIATTVSDADSTR